MKIQSVITCCLAFVLGLQLVAQGTASAATGTTTSYADIKGHWASKDIMELANEGIVKGFPDGTFHPDVPISEEQFMALIYRMLPPIAGEEVDEFAEETYLKKTKGRWSEAMYRKMFIAGVIGYDEPAGTINRSEAARILLGALAAQSEGDKYRGSKAKFFKDVPLEEINLVTIYPIYKLGVMTGYPDGTFRPDDNVTRAQAVVLLKRFREKMAELYPDNVNQQTKALIVQTAKETVPLLQDAVGITDMEQMKKYAKEKKLPVSDAFLEEHFWYLKAEGGVDYIRHPDFDELLYISRIWDNKYRVTVQYYAGELGGCIDRTFYLTSTNGKAFTLIGKNE